MNVLLMSIASAVKISLEMSRVVKNVCCICEKPFEGFGHSPRPLAEDGCCCDSCNYTKVIPARLYMGQYPGTYD